MNMHALLREREAKGAPVRVGLIGAGKFATMFLAQVRKIPGMRLTGVADINRDRALASFTRAGWPDDAVAAPSLEAAAKAGTTCLIEDSAELIASPCIDVVIEATGHPEVGIGHALACIEHKKHVIMVNVEADAVAGPLLARRAREAGVVYSLAYGDQPAMICDMVDWARTAGFEVAAAGKGTKYLPAYHASTPETVWQYYGLTPEQAERGGMNPKMFNSFLDGTKSAIEMAAVANATGLGVNPAGLQFPPCGADDLPRVLKPVADGGLLPLSGGQVEVVSSVERDGRPVYRDLRFGIYVVLRGDSEYIRNCFVEYGMMTDDTGAYTALYRPYHMIGLELGVSVAAIATRGEATGYPASFSGDVVATAKRDLQAGETLDGEGGFCVYGKLMTAADSLACGGVPLGLCTNVPLTAPVKAGQPVKWSDIKADESSLAVRVRREMERMFQAAR